MTEGYHLLFISFSGRCQDLTSPFATFIHWVLPPEALFFILPISVIYSSSVKVTYHDKKWESLWKSILKNITIFPRCYTRTIFNLPLNLCCDLNSVQVRLGKDARRGCSSHLASFHFPGYNSPSELRTALTLYICSFVSLFYPISRFFHFKEFISINNLIRFHSGYYDTSKTCFPDLAQCILITEILSPGFHRPFAIKTLIIIPQRHSLLVYVY